jgi:hypothetical protein
MNFLASYSLDALGFGIREQHQEVTKKETPNASSSGAREALFHGGFWSFKPSLSPFYFVCVFMRIMQLFSSSEFWLVGSIC